MQIEKPSTPVGYSIATSEKEWKDWSLAKRKAIEVHHYQFIFN
jgi:hypothetical protein